MIWCWFFEDSVKIYVAHIFYNRERAVSLSGLLKNTRLVTGNKQINSRTRFYHGSMYHSWIDELARQMLRQVL